MTRIRRTGKRWAITGVSFVGAICAAFSGYVVGARCSTMPITAADPIGIT